jgi:hypothetical protein
VPNRGIIGGMTPRERIPLRPDYGAARRTIDQRLTRAMVAGLLGYVRGTDPAKIAEREWDDPGIDLVLRATSAPASLAASTWGQQLAAGVSVADVLINIGSPSAGATLLQRGLQLNFERGVGTMTVPVIINDATNILFVAENAPIAVKDYTIAAGLSLQPRKAGVIVCFTREMFSYSTPAIEGMVRALIAESLILKIDTHMLDTVADDGVRPGGLRVGVGATTPAAAGDTAMLADVATLAGMVSSVAGNGPIILVGSPKQAARMRISKDIAMAHEVLVSPSLADKTVIAIAANALVSITGGAPQFDFDAGSTLHMSTTPAALSSGTGPTIATPIRSLWMTDTVGVKITFQINWGLRSSNGIAYMTAVNW